MSGRTQTTAAMAQTTADLLARAHAERERARQLLAEVTRLIADALVIGWESQRLCDAAAADPPAAQADVARIERAKRSRETVLRTPPRSRRAARRSA